MGAWKEPTFSAWDWRRATLEALGANGSWTLTTSSGIVVSACSIVPATSIGSEATRRRLGEKGSTSPTPSTRTPGPPATSAWGSERIRRRLSWTRSGSRDGAITRMR